MNANNPQSDPIVELELTNDALRRMRTTCFDKCIEQRGSNDELSDKEGKCCDNCVMKYFGSMSLIAKHFQEQQSSMDTNNPQAFKKND